MNKPITVAKVELEEKLAEEIQESGLPAFVIAYMLENILRQLKQIEEQQYRNDLEQWEEAQGAKECTQTS